VQRVLFLIVVAGCATESAVDKCDDLTERLCDRAVACMPSAGNHSTCVQEVQGVLPCGAATDVSASYDRCMSQLETTSCSILFPTNPQTGEAELGPPADCKAVILTSREQSDEIDQATPSNMEAVAHATCIY
jgi:hypothetical protein